MTLWGRDVVPLCPARNRPLLGLDGQTFVAQSLERSVEARGPMRTVPPEDRSTPLTPVLDEHDVAGTARNPAVDRAASFASGLARRPTDAPRHFLVAAGV